MKVIQKIIYTRNKIRLELIPYMTDNFNTNLIESIVRMSNSLRSDSDYIEAEAESKFKRYMQSLLLIQQT